MPRSKKAILWTAAGVACLLALAVSGLLVSPALIHLEAVRDQIQEHLSKEFSGQVEFARIDLSIFPRPHATVTQVRFQAADGVNVRLPSLKVYPKIWPLILGNFQLNRLMLESPEVVLKLQERPKPETAVIEAFQFDRLAQRIIATLLLFIKWQPPDMAFRIANGRLILMEPHQPMLEFSRIEARVNRGGRLSNYSFSGKSNIWRQISIKGWFDPMQSKKAGRIDLSQVQPRMLSGLLFRDSGIQIVEAPLIVSIDFESTGENQLVAVATASLPQLRLKKETTEVLLKGYHARSTLQIEAGQASLSIHELTLDKPRLSLSGRFSCNPQGQRADLALQARGIDVAGLRAAALALAGDHEGVQVVFDIIRDGAVPHMTVNSSGGRIQDLGRFANLVIEGKMSQGNIFVPDIELDMTEVEGQATISGGVLFGEALSARLGNSQGRSGTLTLDLTGDSDLLELDIQVTADLAQLPPVLQRLVTNNGVKSELSRLSQVVGSAAGVLKLGGTTNDVAVTVEASDLHLKLNYDRIPYAISFNQGTVSLDGARMRLAQLEAIVGHFVFSQVSGSFSWQEPVPLMEIQFEKSVLPINQLYTLLQSWAHLPPPVSNLAVKSGTLSLRRSQVQGPLFQPERWRFETDGDIDDLKLASPLLPKTLSIASARIACSPEHLKIYQLRGRMGESSFVQAQAAWNLTTRARFTLASGPVKISVDEVMSWMAPHAVALRSLAPLTGQVTLARVGIDAMLAGKVIHARGDIDRYELQSPKFPGRVSGSGGSFSWEKRRFQLEGLTADVGRSSLNQVTVAVNQADPLRVDASAKSVAVFLAEVQPWLSALIGADPGPAGLNGIIRFAGTRLTGPLLRPDMWLVDASGDLEEVAIPLVQLSQSLLIPQADFRLSSSNSSPSQAIRHTVWLDSLPFRVGDTPMLFHGRLGFNAKTISLEGGLQADLIDWSRFWSGQPRIAEPDTDTWLRRLQGNLQVTIKQFKYADYTWSPTQATIILDTNYIRIVLNQADLCGISFSGIIRLSRNTVELDIVPAAEKMSLGPSLTCLLEQEHLATGEYSLNGELLAKSKPHDLPRALVGDVSFAAANGRIFRLGVLAKILALLNVTEIYRGQAPDLVQEGFAYRSINLTGAFQSGRIVMTECTIDGASMGIACEGDIDLVEQEVDLTVLVAPLRTVDRIISKLPIINSILGGKLISIPFRAIGKIGNLTVIPLSPTAVGSGVLGIMERTLKLPITLIQPLLKQAKNDNPADQQPKSGGTQRPTGRGDD